MYDFSQKWLTSEERAALEGNSAVSEDEEITAKSSKSKIKSKANAKKQNRSKKGKE